LGHKFKIVATLVFSFKKAARLKKINRATKLSVRFCDTTGGSPLPHISNNNYVTLQQGYNTFNQESTFYTNNAKQ